MRPAAFTYNVKWSSWVDHESPKEIVAETTIHKKKKKSRQQKPESEQSIKQAEDTSASNKFPSCSWGLSITLGSSEQFEDDWVR